MKKNEQKWILCDMHLHSQYSSINKKEDKSRVKEMPASNFVEILNNNGVEIFSITDHNYFSAQYYEEIENIINEYHREMAIIPGAELDVYINEINDFIHTCFYFSKKIDIKELEQRIKELYKDNNKPSFIEILKSINELNNKYIVIPHGDKSDKRGIFNVIKDNDFSNINDFYKYAMYKIFNAYDVKPNFYESSINHWAAAFYKNSKSFNRIIEKYNDEDIRILQSNIVKKINDRQYKLNNDEEEIFKYVLEYGSYFAYFSFSDWHNGEEYNPSINNFIFGNSDYPFETFEMATLDPESRIQQTKETKIDIQQSLIKEVKFNIGENEKTVEFTPGLNVIVGKRGSGKSLLASVLKNLNDKDSNDGAIAKYKNLNVNNIRCTDRKGIELSPGSLNSVLFLSQNEIDAIFNNPQEAEAKIKNRFKTPEQIKIKKLEEILDISKEIVPYEKNYKNITTNLLSIKRSNKYEYKEYSLIDCNQIEDNLEKTISYLTKARNSILGIFGKSTDIDTEIENLTILKNRYMFLIDLYNELFKKHNERIASINKQASINEKIITKNRESLHEAMDIIRKNINIKCSIEKTKWTIDNLNIDVPKVEVSTKGKYMFVTYYEIPDNLKDIVVEKLTSTLTWSNHKYEDIEQYVTKTNNRRIKNGKANIADDLKEFVYSEAFQYKYKFYEIKNNQIDYEKDIKNVEDLQFYSNEKSIKDLSETSLGVKSVAYLDMLFDLEDSILVFDQPEDNIDNDYISNYLVPNIKKNKKTKQLIFVTHNPSVAVYGDAFNYIFVSNDGNDIEYKNYFIEKQEDKDAIIKILEGGKNSFSNRNKKYGNILGVEEYENK